MNTDIRSDELMHYGVLGMKWGVRRYQKKDGTLTAAGKKRRVELNKPKIEEATRVLNTSKEQLQYRKEFEKDAGDRLQYYVDKTHKRQGKKYQEYYKDVEEKHEKYLETLSNVQAVETYIKGLQGTPLRTCDFSIAEEGRQYVVKQTRLIDELDKLTEITDPLWHKRYFGEKLTAEETKILNDGLERSEELVNELYY